jgi:uncharacterized damage-inducible protein DinB
MSAGTISLKDVAFGDLERELTVTRRVLEAMPEEKFGWTPHEKSMTVARLASHVADLPQWIQMTLAQDELDMAAMPPPPPPSPNRKELLERFDRHVAALREAVARFDMANFNKPWSMRQGQEVVVTRPRATVYRVWCLNHMINHRAQLCLYLRLLNVPVPTVYFNTADDPSWVFE